MFVCAFAFSCKRQGGVYLCGPVWEVKTDKGESSKKEVSDIREREREREREV